MSPDTTTHISWLFMRLLEHNVPKKRPLIKMGCYHLCVNLNKPCDETAKKRRLIHKSERHWLAIGRARISRTATNSFTYFKPTI